MERSLLCNLVGLTCYCTLVTVQAQTCVYKTPDQKWQWDLTSLSKEGGYPVDAEINYSGKKYQAHFNLNLCVDSPESCIPEGYVPDSKNGIAIMYWDTAPPCQENPQGEKVCEQGGVQVTGSCCTAPCSVLSSNPNPEFTKALDISKLGQGAGDGIILQFPTIQDTNFNRSICASDTPVYAAQYAIECDTSVDLVVTDVLPNDCFFNFVMRSKYGCAKLVSSTTSGPSMPPTTTTPHSPNHMSGGSIFILILFILAALYFGIGTLILRCTSNVWQIPNRQMWINFWSLVTDGVKFIGSGCKKPTSGYVESGNNFGAPTGDYVTASDSSRATTQGNEFGNADNITRPDEPYDDL